MQVLDGLPLSRRPRIVRGDCGFGPDTLMRPLEARQQRYLFKRRRSTNVKRPIERLCQESGGTDAGQGWEGQYGAMKLTGWEAPRRVVVLRRPLHGELLIAQEDDNGPQLTGYAYAGVVTTPRA